MRGFLKFLAVLMLLAYSWLFTVFWLSAYTFGYRATIHINKWNEANPEALFLFVFFWPVVSVGLYFLAVDNDWFGAEDERGRSA